MSSQSSSHAICAKCRAMSANMLKKEDFINLSNMSGLREIVVYLTENSSYSEEFSGIDLQNINRFALERILRGNLYHTYTKLYNFALGDIKESILVMMQKFVIDILISFISELYIGIQRNALSPLQLEILENSNINISMLLKATNMDDALNSLKGTPYYYPLKSSVSSGKLNLNLFEVDMYDQYYKNVYDQFDKFSKGTNIIGLLADAHNLARIFRFKLNFNTPPEHIYPYLINIYGKLKKNDYVKICNMSDLDFLQYIQNTEFVKTNFAGNDRAPSEYINHYFSKYYKKLFVNSVANVEVPYSYLSLKELEVINLIHVIEGVRYKMPSEDILKDVVGI